MQPIYHMRERPTQLGRLLCYTLPDYRKVPLTFSDRRADQYKT
jgi:hypothetical protein